MLEHIKPDSKLKLLDERQQKNAGRILKVDDVSRIHTYILVLSNDLCGARSVLYNAPACTYNINLMHFNFPNLHFIFQFVIVGAVKSSPAYTLLREEKIRIFDVIEVVNDKSARELQLLVPSKDPQECVDMYLNHQVRVKMHINHSISLPPVSNTLDCGTIMSIRVDAIAMNLLIITL